jgi:hypothetical protein
MVLSGRVALLFLICPFPQAFADLSKDDTALLQDSGGWEYLSMADVNNGFKTTHACFDEQKGRGPCHGTLLLSKDGTFSQDISAEGKTLHRHGTYELVDDGIIFADELETKDGPYSINLDRTNSLLTLETVQAGVTIRVKLQLEREFRRQKAEANKQKQ